MPQYETRSQRSSFEIREAKRSDSIGTLVGTAIVFDVESEDLGGFCEIIRQGSVEESLRQYPDLRAFWNHDTANLLGRATNPSGEPTLRLWTNEVGLHYELDLPDTTIGRDVAALARRGDLRENSFGFDVDEDRWQKRADGQQIREVVRMKRVYEVSPVSIPAYPQTELAIRSLRNWVASQEKPKRRSMMLIRAR